MIKRQDALLRLGIERATGTLDGFPIGRKDERTVDLSSMPSVDSRRFKTLLRDHELLGEILQKYPKEVSAIYRDVILGKLESAKAKAASIGLTEKAFQEKSGGWIIVVVVIVVLLYSSDAE